MARRRSSAAAPRVFGPTLYPFLDRPWLERELLCRLVPGYAADPAPAIVAAADRSGLGPTALFDPDWYRTRNRLSAAEPAILHYIEHGAAAGFDPHPLFSVPYYLAQAPEAAGDALRHFLEHGGPAGLDCHPLFFGRWYWEQNADVRNAGVIPIVHYLKHGAGEGRDPSPLFSTRFYLEQTSDEAAKANPLLHYVQFGEQAGLRPHPSFHPDAVARTFRATRPAGALATYVDVIGRAQPERAALLEAAQEEPGTVPPPPALASRAPGEATLAGVALLQALGLHPSGPASAERYHLQKLLSIQSDPDVVADLAAAMTADPGAPGTAALLEGAGLLPLRLPEAPDGDPEAGILPRYRARQFEAARRFQLDPGRAGTVAGTKLISILLPVYRSRLHLLERAILSVICQTYANWELCVVDDGSGEPGLTAALERFAAADKRIRLAALARNGGISAASNRALRLARGTYVGLLDHDDMLAANALERAAARLEAKPETDLLYTDECLIDCDDRPLRLFTKPDWSPTLLLGSMYTGHFTVYRAALVRAVGGFRSAFDFSQDYDLALRVAEREPVVAHVREVLYGWRLTPQSASMGGKPDARKTNIAAVQAALERRGWGGRAVAEPMTNRVRRELSPAPLVSIVVPSDDARHILQTVMSIVAHTEYPAYEIVVVARDPVIAEVRRSLRAGSVRFVPFNAAFNFSAKCNAGAQVAKGEHLVFYNDDVRVLTPSWLEALLEALTLPGVGAAAPKLLYEDNRIQHAGMVIGTRRLVTTAFHCFPHASPVHFNLAQHLREVSLLSGACLAISAHAFRQLGGFDARSTPIAHSDVDLCLRLREAGYACLYTPHAALTHIGHASLETAERQRAFCPDKADIHLMRRFGKLLEEDPYFPPPVYELVAIGDQLPFRYHAAARPPDARAHGDALVVSHDLSASGAPLVAYAVARTLLDAGRHVLVMSPVDGPFRASLLALGADVMIEPRVLWADPEVIAVARNFDLVVTNTVLTWRLLPALAPFTRAYLYAHETGLTTEIGAADPGFAAALAQAAGVWAGSERSAAALRALGADPVVLEYGVDLPDPKLLQVRGREIVIAVLATLEPRKGQDLAIKAFAQLPAGLRERCRLRLHGRPHDLPFTQAIKDLARSEPRIEIGPELDLEAYRRALAAADIVLCPSRDDTLPIVSLDALAAGKVLVVSRDVGTSAYLQDGVSGFVLEANHPDDIASVLGRIIAQRQRWPEIGEAARRVFQEQFSRARFEGRLLALLSESASVPQAAD
ncbi:MAG TPA: glycosyltransferase [Acetobacteraceae bacterium]|nr:glycosyltransferase [Acetobacteraceae bacterium]